MNIYRFNGVIHSADAPNRRAVLQVVGKRVNLALETDWGDRSPLTQIVAIGSKGSIDGGLLEQKFSACIARPMEQEYLSNSFQQIPRLD